MMGELVNGVFSGTWKQSDGSGKFRINSILSNGTFTGTWSSDAENNTKQYPLTFRNCKSYEAEIQSSCQYGWSGGVAGSGVKWVNATTIRAPNVNSVVIQYNWKNGTMTGSLVDGKIKGTWVQDGSKGKFEVRPPNQAGVSEGWWTDDTDKSNTKYALFMKQC